MWKTSISKNLNGTFFIYKKVCGKIDTPQTAIKTKVVDVIFDSPEGDVYFKVIRAETFIKQDDKWYFVLGQGTNFMTQEEFDAYRKLHTTKQ